MRAVGRRGRWVSVGVPVLFAALAAACGDASVRDGGTAAEVAVDPGSAAASEVGAAVDVAPDRAVDVFDPFDPSRVDAGSGGPPPALTETVTLHIVGDSTAALFPATDPRVGWGAVLGSFFGAGIAVDDAARSGRSSKSFIDEGHWAGVKAKLVPGDYVFIEFGHNDEKYGDAARYTIPNTSYRYYLKTYIAETRALGGFAVLLTSICRRQFSGTAVPDSHAAYTAAVLAVAAETGTPVIDLEAKTNAWLTALGPTASVAYFAPGDNTHLNDDGARVVAAMVVQGVRELGLPIVRRTVDVELDGGLVGEAGASREAGLAGPIDGGDDDGGSSAAD